MPAKLKGGKSDLSCDLYPRIRREAEVPVWLCGIYPMLARKVSGLGDKVKDKVGKSWGARPILHAPQPDIMVWA